VPKPLVFTAHARQVMAERELAEDWVDRTVRAPEWREPDPADPAVERRFRTVPEREDRIMRVACLESATDIRILSAFLDRGARRPQ
jgi:hypothetical protein